MSPRPPLTDAQPPLASLGERRRDPRYGTTISVEIVRENDSRRLKLPAELVDVSIAGIGVLSGESISPGDRVKVRLSSTVRRFLKEVHGIVRWAQPAADGRHRIGIDLAIRFSALDMQLLKPIAHQTDPGQRIWI